MTEFDGFVTDAGKPGYHAYSAQPLTTVAHNNVFDMNAFVGQRQSTWRFDLINGVTDERLGELHPFYQPATITHDASRTIKRDLRLSLGQSDLDAINPLTDRVLPYMIMGGVAYQLGRFMFGSKGKAIRTGGDESSDVLTDEMGVVDREILVGFAARGSCDQAMRDLTDGLLLPRGRVFAASPYPASGGWGIGTGRGSICNELSLQGDLETPWMDNTGVMRAVRTVDPATSVADLSFDDGYPVVADTISASDDQLDAPNRFVVVGNGAVSNAVEIVGVYDIPASAPHSIANRGFAIQRTANVQLSTSVQARAVARSMGLSAGIVEQVEITTPPDPRHDGYQVVRWRDLQWLETAWSMNCEPGGDMTHTLRRAYV